MKVRRIGALKHKSVKFEELSFILLGENNKGQEVYVSFKAKLYLVEDFRANILIKNDILAPKDFILNVRLGHTVVGSCKVKITIRVRQKSQFLRKKLLVETDNIVFPHSEAMVLLYPISLSDSRNFLFHPVAQAYLTLFAYIINYEITKVLVRNTSD